ncbi:ZIP family metal transporter [Metabacillus iocasae]|uniref:ZIP family zinc transporter n=1 Tax=Priestia iocasae TaxID=2291674 RepID=A0ABS2QS50_9BACI|nr:ZIP family metal transporter [Metabacillus iocasae]MBM7702269.1 ZIP family zinc transporter [Metabacillus iocasae]
MWNAALWGGVAGSAVFLGALTGILFSIRKKWIGVIMAFGTGVLIGAASFELLLDSIEEGGLGVTSIGFLGGATVFTLFEYLISKKGGHERKRSKESAHHSAGFAIFIGTVIDAIPESVIIGVSVLEEGTVSWLLVIAIFISNFPEGLSSSIGLKKDGYSNKKILFLWLTVFLLSALSSLGGYAFLNEASDALLAMIGAFAAGGVTSMVASAMMPEAYEEGGPIVGFVASLGLLCSLLLTHLG